MNRSLFAILSFAMVSMFINACAATYGQIDKTDDWTKVITSLRVPVSIEEAIDKSYNDALYEKDGAPRPLDESVEYYFITRRTAKADTSGWEIRSLVSGEYKSLPSRVKGECVYMLLSYAQKYRWEVMLFPQQMKQRTAFAYWPYE